MRVRKHKKKVTMLEEWMLENGEMDFLEIKDWMNARIRGGITSNWLGNVLSKSGLFERIGDSRVDGIQHGYVVGVYDSKRRNL
jgi:hypothetical protein